MRYLVFFSFVLFACARASEPPAPTTRSTPDPALPDAAAGARDTSVERMHIDIGDLGLDVPGQWHEHPIEDGYDLRKDAPLESTREEIIVSLVPPAAGLDLPNSVGRMSEAQQRGMSSQCKHVAVTGGPTLVTVLPHATRRHVVCSDRTIIAYVAAAIGSKILSYGHYWYDVAAFSPELEHSDDAILATIRFKAAGTVCPPSILAQAIGHTGTCLQISVLGADIIEDCRRAFESRGWTRVDALPAPTGGGASEDLVCYREPQ
jgi:hypothetical protein